MNDKKHMVIVNGFEQRLMVHSLTVLRNDLLAKQKPTEDVNALLLKVIDAPVHKKLCRSERNER